MAFLADFRYYMSGTEAPDTYLTWTGLSLLSAVMSRQFWTYHGRYPIHPMIYVVLVGEAGSGKSSCRSEAKRIFVRNFPNMKVSSSIQSREDIVDLMAADDCIQTWKDAEGAYGPAAKIYDYRPFYIISNELASLLSVDKEKMVEFLVDVYDEDTFSTGFKGQRQKNPEIKQWFENPAVCVLACATPRWFMQNLKLDLFEGGLGRRLIIVNSEKSNLIDDPQLPLDAGPVMDSVIEHLKRVRSSYGEFRKTPEGVAWWKEWYHDPKRFNQDDPILLQFHQTKHIQLLKIAMLLSMCDYPFSFELDVQHLKGALILLDTLETDVAKLTRGVGRNVLAGVSAAMMDFVAKVGGKVSEVHLRKFFWRELQIPECHQILQHLLDTEQLRLYSAGGHKFFFTPTGWQAYCQAHSSELALLSDGAPAPVPGGATFLTSYREGADGQPLIVPRGFVQPQSPSASPEQPNAASTPAPPSSLEYEPPEPSKTAEKPEA